MENINLDSRLILLSLELNKNGMITISDLFRYHSLLFRYSLLLAKSNNKNKHMRLIKTLNNVLWDLVKQKKLNKK